VTLPKRPVTMRRNARSQSSETRGHDAETGGHDGPEYAPVGSPLSAEQLLERRLVQLGFRKQLLQLRVLRLELLQPLGVRHRHPAVLGLPVVERRLADAVLAQQFSDLRAGLRLAQYRDDLFFLESLLHRPLPRQSGL